MKDSPDGSRALQNARREAFCLAYTGEHRRNAAAAYRAAGYAGRTSGSCRSAAWRLLDVPEVAARVAYLDGRALERCRLTRRDANDHLAAVCTVTLADFLGPDGRVDPEKLRDPALAQAVAKATPVYDREGVLLDYRLELKDSMRAYELLGLTARDESPAAARILIIEH